MKYWLALVRPGDWVLALAAAGVVAISFPLFWRGGQADQAIIRVDGRVFAEYPLDRQRRIEVSGALGTTLVEIDVGRARVASDPGPRQYCVRQGWLSRNGAVAICAPSHVSLALSNRRGNGYDSLNY